MQSNGMSVRQGDHSGRLGLLAAKTGAEGAGMTREAGNHNVFSTKRRHASASPVPVQGQTPCSGQLTLDLASAERRSVPIVDWISQLL